MVAEYESILKKLPTGQAGEISAKEEKEKPLTIKNRIKRAGKSLGMTDLKVRSVGETGDTIQYWRETKG